MVIDRIESNPALEKAEPAKSEKQSARSRSPGNGKEPDMLWPVGVILLVLWAQGLVSGYTMGGIFAIAVIVLALQFFQGRRRV